MALRVFKDRRIGYFAGLKEKVQTISVSGAASAGLVATRIVPYGVTVITTTGTGASHRLGLKRPLGPGIRKSILLKLNSTNDVIIVNESTADKFWGSTINSALFSTAAGAKGQGNLELISVSTAQWALLSARHSTTLGAFPYVLQNSSN